MVLSHLQLQVLPLDLHLVVTLLEEPVLLLEPLVLCGQHLVSYQELVVVLEELCMLVLQLQNQHLELLGLLPRS